MRLITKIKLGYEYKLFSIWNTSNLPADLPGSPKFLHATWPECYIAVIIKVKPPYLRETSTLFYNCGFDCRTWLDRWSIPANVVIANISVLQGPLLIKSSDKIVLNYTRETQPKFCYCYRQIMLKTQTQFIPPFRITQCFDHQALHRTLQNSP